MDVVRTATCQSEEIPLEFHENGVHQLENSPTTEAKAKKSTFEIVTTYVKYLVSSAVTLTYLAYIMWGIWTGEAVLPAHFVAHFVIFIFCMVLVAYLEGLQVAILAVEHDDYNRYKESHPRAYQIMHSVKQGNNVERFLVGRQFFTIFVMTLIAQVTTFPNISHLGINSVVWFIFIQTGLPGAIVVTTIGSLQPQLLAAKDPWKFMDLYGAVSTLYLCYGLEFTGICTHFAYLLIGFLRKTLFRSDVPPKGYDEKVLTPWEHVFEVCKYILSFSVIGFYISYLMWGIWTGQAVLPVPPVVCFLVLCFCGVFLAHLEGLQVAVLVSEQTNLDNYKETRPRAYALMKRATHDKNVRRFLIGRQFFVIFVVFLINQTTIFPDIANFGADSTLWLVFFQLGFPTALNILCWCQLPTQLLANQDAFLFMNRPGPRFTLEVCLFTEITGLAHFSWVASAISRATWFRIVKNVPDFTKLEMANQNMKKGTLSDLETNHITDDTCTEDNKAYHTEELQLELHTDISHAIKDADTEL